MPYLRAVISVLMFFLFSLISLLELGAQTQRFPMNEFTGVNLRREDPIQYLTHAAGCVREYHDWIMDEGDIFQYQYTNPNQCASAPFPNNTYRFGPVFQGQSSVNFPNFYTQINQNIAISGSSPAIGVSLKYCLPRFSGNNGDTDTNHDLGFDPTLNNKASFSEFKPIETYEHYNSDACPTNPTRHYEPYFVTPVDDPESPKAYRHYADWATQFALHFSNSDGTSVISKAVDNTLTNQKLVNYIEVWNEQDKFWFDGLAQTGSYNMTKFTPSEYAAMAVAAYSGTTNVPGIKEACAPDVPPNFVMGGVSELDDADITYVDKIIHASEILIPNFRYDVINFHHYSDRNSQGTNGVGFGVSPEDDYMTVINTMTGNHDPLIDHGGIVTLKHQLRKIRRLYRNHELWLSEFGYDTNDGSDIKVPTFPATNNQPFADQQEVQGRWLVRTYLDVAASNWDRAMQFCIRDDDARYNQRFGNSGIVQGRNANFAPKKSYFYISTMRSSLHGLRFSAELDKFRYAGANSWNKNEDWQYEVNARAPRQYLFRNEPTPELPNEPTNLVANDVVAIWLPTSSNASSQNYNYWFINETNETTVTVTTSTAPSLTGITYTLPINRVNVGDRNCYITLRLVTELPQYITIGGTLPAIVDCPHKAMAVPFACDAVQLSWFPVANAHHYQLYYYERRDSDDPATLPVFDIGSPYWHLYPDNIPGACGSTTISGLQLANDNYYFVLIAVDAHDNTSNPNDCGIFQGRTGGCENVITTAGINLSAMIPEHQAILEGTLMNYNGMEFCHPQVLPINGEWTGCTNGTGVCNGLDYIRTLEFNFNTPMQIDAIRLLDGSSEGNFKVYFDGILVTEYSTVGYANWTTRATNSCTSPVTNVRLEMEDDNARIQRIVFIGTPAQIPVQIDCCRADATITGNDATVLNAAAALTNNSVFIDGTLTVGSDHTFNNQRLIMGSGARIVVNSDINCTFNNCVIESCHDMWQGIQLNQRGILTMSGCTVRDAEKVITVKRGKNNTTKRTFWALTNNLFEQNQHVLYIENFGSGNDISNASYFTGCTFDGTNADLKQPYLNQTGWTPYAISGVTSKGIVGNLRDRLGTTVNLNHFKNLQYGIYAEKTSLLLRNSTFEHIKPYGAGQALSIAHAGSGVCALQGSYVNQIGQGKFTTPSNFNDCTYGFYIDRSTFSINQNNMDNVTYGVREYNAPAGVNSILFNRIVAVQDAIWLNSNLQPSINVNYNHLYNYLDRPAYGIFVTNPQNTTTNAQKVYTILHNTIEVKNAPNINNIGAGIALFNVAKATVYHNTINMNAYASGGFNQRTCGIYLSNVKESSICNNPITGVYTNQHFGIYAINSSSNTILCNTIKNFGEGLTFSLDCTSDQEIGNNSIEGYTYGLRVRGNTSTGSYSLMGAQTHTKNQWLSVAPNFAADAKHDLWEDVPFDVKADNFINVYGGMDVNGNPIISALKPIHVEPDNVGTDWFYEDPDLSFSTIQPCPISLEGVPTDCQIDGEKEGYKKIAASLSTHETLPKAYQQILQRNAYDYVKSKYQNEAIPSDYQAFMSQFDIGNLGAFAKMDALLNGNSDQMETLGSELQELQNKWTDVHTSNQAEIDIFDASSPLEIATMLENGWQPTASVEEDTYFEKMQIVLEKLMAQQITEASELQQINQEIIEGNDFEQKEALVNAQSFKLIESGNVQELNESLLKIASECPDESGYATLKARAFLAMLNGTIPSEWLQCFDDISEIKIEKRSVEDVSTKLDVPILSLMPNPTQDRIIISLTGTEAELKSFGIFNSNGRVMLEEEIIGNSISIGVAKLENGLYFIKVRLSNGDTIAKKFSVQKP
jgi:hypothetical protein